MKIEVWAGKLGSCGRMSNSKLMFFGQAMKIQGAGSEKMLKFP
jgi:hypothetical protein